MNKKLIGVMIVAALGVSACGAGAGGKAEKYSLGVGSTTTAGGKSSGGTSSNNATNTNNNTTNTTPDATATTTTNGSFGLNNAIGLGFDVNGDTDQNYIAPANKAEVNILQVENHKIVLVPESKINDKSWYQTEKKAAYTGSGSTPYREETVTFSTIGNQLKYAKFGELYDEFEKRYQFAQGELTPSDKIPTEFKNVTYKGQATYNPKLEKGNEIPKTAKSEFLVNFGERTVIGQIQPENPSDFENVTLKAVLKPKENGNQFEGVNGDTTSPSQGMIVQGGFYGPNAEEMAGVYFSNAEGKIDYKKSDPSKPSGTFGATQQ